MTGPTSVTAEQSFRGTALLRPHAGKVVRYDSSAVIALAASVWRINKRTQAAMDASSRDLRLLVKGIMQNIHPSPLQEDYSKMRCPIPIGNETKGD